MTEVTDLAQILERAPAAGVFTQILGRGRGATITVFSVAKGDSIPSHTNKNEAVAFMLNGRATVTVGEQESVVSHGSWIHFPPGSPHSLSAPDGRFEMLLVVLKRP